MVRFLIDPASQYSSGNNHEPIDLAGLKTICLYHKYGSTLLAVGIGCIAGGLEIYLIDAQQGSIIIGFWGVQVEPEWFTCWLQEQKYDTIEASVSTSSPEPYLAFFQQDVGDSLVTYFDEPIVETGGTLVRFHIHASDPAAPGLILRFYNCTGGSA